MGARADPGPERRAVIEPVGWERGEWSLEAEGVLRKSAVRGQPAVQIEAATLGSGRVISAGANPFNGGAWVAGTNRVLSIGRDGSVKSSRKMLAGGRSALLAADEAVWIREESALRGISLRQEGDRTVALAPETRGAVESWDVDAVRGLAWLGSGTKLFGIDLRDGRLSRVIDVPSAVRFIAYDHATGRLWALLVDRVMAFDQTGAPRFSRSNTLLRLDAPDAARFSDELGVLLVRDLGKTMALPGEASPSIELPRAWSAAKAAPVVLPSISLDRRHREARAGDVIGLKLAARCGRRPCDLGDDWIARFRIEARIGGKAITDVTIDPASRSASLRLPSRIAAGKQSIVVQAVDAFGHRSPPISRWIEVSGSNEAKGSAAIVPARAKSAGAYCVASPALDTTDSFVPFASLERLEVRSGRFGAADWEWGLGANTQQAGKFVTANLNWVSGRGYRFVLVYDGAGNATMQVLDGETQIFQKVYTGSATEQLRSGNAIRLYAKSSAGIGAGNRVSVVVNEINGTAVSGAIATSGTGEFSESAMVFALSPGQGFEVRGTLTMDFAGSYPPTGSRLNVTVNAGNVACSTGNLPPTLYFNSPGEASEFFSPALVGVEVYAEDPEGAIASLVISSPGPDGFLLDAGPVTHATHDWNGLLTGSYTITATVTDAAGATASQSVSFQVVPDPTDQPILDAWNGLRDAVDAGDYSTALEFFTPAARERYGRAFSDLQSDAAISLGSLSVPVRVSLDEEIAEYVVMRGSGTARQVFFVNFVRGEDGLWRIEGM